MSERSNTSAGGGSPRYGNFVLPVWGGAAPSRRGNERAQQYKRGGWKPPLRNLRPTCLGWDGRGSRRQDRLKPGLQPDQGQPTGRTATDSRRLRSQSTVFASRHLVKVI